MYISNQHAPLRSHIGLEVAVGELGILSFPGSREALEAAMSPMELPLFESHHTLSCLRLGLGLLPVFGPTLVDNVSSRPKHTAISPS